jgi:hypothetical protein
VYLAFDNVPAVDKLAAKVSLVIMLEYISYGSFAMLPANHPIFAILGASMMLRQVREFSTQLTVPPALRLPGDSVQLPQID